MATYLATYIEHNRELIVHTDPTLTLGDFVGKHSYMRVANKGLTYTINLSKYMLWKPNLNLNTTVSAAATGLTDLEVDGYTTTIIPTVDPVSGAFRSRINAYDAIAQPDVTVSWTSIGTPGIRNDVYRKSLMDDLVLTSHKQRDFSNSLVAVNGVFHKTYLYAGELYVQDGFANIKNVQHTRVSVYDTGPVGGHSVVPIKIENVDITNTTPQNGVTLTFKDVDFTGVTPLLVLGGYLHVLDGTYRIINRNRMVIDTCKIDLINDFLHNPNTIYTKDALQKAIFEDRLKTHRDAPLTVYDKIMSYLWNDYPTARQKTTTPYNFVAFDPPPPPPAPIPVADQIIYYLQNSYPWARDNTMTPTNVMSYTRHKPDRHGTPSVKDDIYAFLQSYPSLIPANRVMLTDYEWTMKYERLISIIGSIPIERFNDPSFIYNTILSPHTFIVLVKNPALFIKRYALQRTLLPSQYQHHGRDTPRGTLFYNRRHAIPYLQYSDSRRGAHNFSIDFANGYQDVYKTSINPPAIPSPLYDLKHDQINDDASLLELYAAT